MTYSGNLRRLAVLFIVLVGFCCIAVSAWAQAAKPNILLIVGDDHAWPFFGFMGDTVIQTPNMDRLADSGVVFPVAHVSASVCIPSLRSLLTGLYPKDREPLHQQVSFAHFLGQAGYGTYGYGKIWGGFTGLWGFDESVKSKKLPRKTLDPLFQYIDTHPEPWLIWYGPKLPHTPFNAPSQFRDLYRGLGLNKYTEKYFANISWFDFWVGQLLDGLEARQLRDKTLIIYINDNGFFFRRSKHSLHEDGFRTPIVVSYPGVVPAGLRLDQMAHAIDILPTLLDYAGIPIPAKFEGMSLRPLVEGNTVPWRSYLFDQKRKKRMVRTQNGLRYWDLGAGRRRLFDLNTDPRETTDLINDPTYQSVIPVLQNALDSWWTP